MFQNIIDWIRNNRTATFWIGISVAILASISILWWAFSPSKSQPATMGAGWTFLKIAFAGLIWAAYASREKENLAWTFAGIATLIFLVLLGKLDTLSAWGVLGLPIMATFGIWGYARVTDGSRMKSFLGFTSGILILFWMFLLYIEHSAKINIGFLSALFPSNEVKIIFTIFLATFIFATWKRSKIFYGISFVVLLSFFGNAIINEISNRFPDKLTLPSEVSEGAGSLLKSTGKAMKKLSTAIDNPTPPTPKPANIEAPASSSATPVVQQPVQQSIQPQTVTTTTQTIVAKKYPVKIEWQEGSVTRFIDNLILTQEDQSLRISSNEITLTASGSNNHYSNGDWSDVSNKSGKFNADINADGSGTGKFIGASDFRIVRR